MLGMLGNPLVTLVWAFEQADFHILGSSTRASDIRIFLSFFTNVSFIVAIELILHYNDVKNAIIISVVLSFLSSHNIWASIGIEKPFSIVNEKIQ